MFFSAFSWRSHGVPRPLALSIERDGEMRARGDGLGHVLGDRGRARLLEISWKKMGEPQQNTPKNIQKTTKKWKNIYNKACSRYILWGSSFSVMHASWNAKVGRSYPWCVRFGYQRSDHPTIQFTKAHSSGGYFRLRYICYESEGLRGKTFKAKSISDDEAELRNPNCTSHKCWMTHDDTKQIRAITLGTLW